MVDLHVVVDEVLTSAPGCDPRYAEHLVRALIAGAPRGTAVRGFVSASTEEEYALLLERLAGLSGLDKSAFTRAQLALAWQRGFTRSPAGMLHSPSLFAPLAAHDRLHNAGQQTVVTIHDARAWADPEALDPRALRWQLAMGARARRYADAVVVPDHAVAERVGEALDIADRIRVIAAAPTVASADATTGTPEGLPASFVLSSAAGPSSSGGGATHLLLDMLDALPAELSLVVIGQDAERVVQAAQERGLAADRVRGFEPATTAERASLLAAALAFVHPSAHPGFGLDLLDAMAAGCPVVALDADSPRELLADAAHLVEGGEGAGARFAEAVRALREEGTVADEARVRGTDRAGVFSWRSVAEKVWQLHADL